MNIGKALFAQLMDFLPWSTFARIVARYGGDARVRTLCCAHLPSVHPFIELPDLIIRAAQAEWAGHRLHQCRRPLWHRGRGHTGGADRRLSAKPKLERPRSCASA